VGVFRKGGSPVARAADVGEVLRRQFFATGHSLLATHEKQASAELWVVSLRAQP